MLLHKLKEKIVEENFRKIEKKIFESDLFLIDKLWESIEYNNWNFSWFGDLVHIFESILRLPIITNIEKKKVLKIEDITNISHSKITKHYAKIEDIPLSEYVINEMSEDEFKNKLKMFEKIVNRKGNSFVYQSWNKKLIFSNEDFSHRTLDLRNYILKNKINFNFIPLDYSEAKVDYNTLKELFHEYYFIYTTKENWDFFYDLLYIFFGYKDTWLHNNILINFKEYYKQLSSRYIEVCTLIDEYRVVKIKKSKITQNFYKILSKYQKAYLDLEKEFWKEHYVQISGILKEPANADSL